jgi:hypothetical protein
MQINTLLKNWMLLYFNKKKYVLTKVLKRKFYCKRNDDLFKFLSNRQAFLFFIVQSEILHPLLK